MSCGLVLESTSNPDAATMSPVHPSQSFFIVNNCYQVVSLRLGKDKLLSCVRCICVFFLANTCKGHFRKERFLLTLGLPAHSPLHWEGHGGSNAKQLLCHIASTVRSQRVLVFSLLFPFFSFDSISVPNIGSRSAPPPLSKFLWKHLRIHTQRYIS